MAASQASNGLLIGDERAIFLGRVEKVAKETNPFSGGQLITYQDERPRGRTLCSRKRNSEFYEENMKKGEKQRDLNKTMFSRKTARYGIYR